MSASIARIVTLAPFTPLVGVVGVPVMTQPLPRLKPPGSPPPTMLQAYGVALLPVAVMDWL